MAISPRQLQIEVKHLMKWCSWPESFYWSSREPKQEISQITPVIRIAYLTDTQWAAFIFTKYHQPSVEVIQQIPKSDRFFYQHQVNRWKQFTVWCIADIHFGETTRQIKNFPDVEIEFIVPDKEQKPDIPEPFEEMRLKFYPLGLPC